MTRQILVTGADGFVGRHLCRALAANRCAVRATVRRERPSFPALPGIDVRVTGDLEAQPEWGPLVEGVDAVIHLAGRAHVTRETAVDPTTVFQRVNVVPTLDLFKACLRAGVRRMVFVSSIGVVGVRSEGHAFTEDDEPHPIEPYARSKWDAERGLAALATQGGTELVVVRPTLVCGPFARGNFDRLIRLVRRQLPLPLGSVDGRRSFVGVRNLCDLLELCALHPRAAGRTYLAADPDVLSAQELLVTLAGALGVKVRLWRFPPSLLRLIGQLVGRGSEIRRLTESLLVDASLARRELGWRNQVALTDELAAMARASMTSD